MFGYNVEYMSRVMGVVEWRLREFGERYERVVSENLEFRKKCELRVISLFGERKGKLKRNGEKYVRIEGIEEND